MVPAYAVTYPEWITVDEIERERNAEVRRVLIERYGQSKYLVDAGAEEIARDACGVLYRKDIEGDEPLVMVRVLNSTPEHDGSLSKEDALTVFGNDALVVSGDAEAHEMNNVPLCECSDDARFKDYFLRVPPAIRTARAAVAWSFDLKSTQYAPAFQS